MGLASEVRRLYASNLSSDFYYYDGNKDDKKAQKKLSAAIQKYAKLLPGEFPLMLYDSTVFGSGTEGFLMSTRGVYNHSLWQSAEFAAYPEISRIAPNADGDNLYVNEIKLDAIGFTDKAAIAETMNYVMRRVAEFSQK